ncbi:MAG: hypothetical protein ACFFCS_25975 [Candidatus Hodarchaeota archaeon]
MLWNPKEQLDEIITADVEISKLQDNITVKFKDPKMLLNPLVRSVFTPKTLAGIAQLVDMEIDLSCIEIIPLKNGYKIRTKEPNKFQELFTKFFNKEFIEDAFNSLKSRFPPKRVDPSRSKKYFKEWDDKFFDDENLKDCYSKWSNSGFGYNFVSAEHFKKSSLFKIIYDNISEEWVNEYRIKRLEEYLFSDEKMEQMFITSFLLSKKMYYREPDCEYDRILDYFPDDFKAKHAQRIYHLYFDNGGKIHTGLIMKLTSIPPDEDIIQEQYNKWLEGDDLLTIEEHIIITGYKPKFNDELLKKKMQLYSTDIGYCKEKNVGPLLLEKLSTGKQTISKDIVFTWDSFPRI